MAISGVQIGADMSNRNRHARTRRILLRLASTRTCPCCKPRVVTAKRASYNSEDLQRIRRPNLFVLCVAGFQIEAADIFRQVLHRVLTVNECYYDVSNRSVVATMQPDTRRAGHGNDRVWKAWKAIKPASHPSHTLWKSLRDYHIPTAPTTRIRYLEATAQRTSTSTQALAPQGTCNGCLRSKV